ncbi:hypothetical protein GALMADRAFT_447376 [Galerina marginata CBS 339.88]|uniref:Uncharacterized protein n=1 Tax=Galerina marginata (strain CBS 339.88) TaxID=685588 RepID=A0A067T9C2_GALM3|nr:hypothetical protein GALMADRAFT_447376 [Galerina marginata CBS 339.88]
MMEREPASLSVHLSLLYSRLFLRSPSYFTISDGACSLFVCGAVRCFEWCCAFNSARSRKAQQARLAARNPWLKPAPSRPGEPPRPRKPRKPKLPQELVDLIIDYLWDQQQALKTCSLVAKSFVLQTRIHLFSKLDIKLPYPTRNSSLKTLLEKAPYLTKYVRDLVVVILSSDGDDDGDDPFLGVLPLFTETTTLTIKAYGGIPRDWQTEVTPNARALFSSFVLANPVNAIALHNILNFDTILLARCTQLCHLELSGQTNLIPYHFPQYYTIQPPRISSLTIGEWGESPQSLLDCFTVPRPAFILNNIQKLDIHENVAMWAFVNLPFLQSTVEDLIIRLRGSDHGIPVPEPISITQLRNLTNLELQCVDDSSQIAFTFRSMRILESISQPCRLQKLTFLYDPNPGRRTAGLPFNEVYWGCVDWALFYLQLAKSTVICFKYGINVLLSDPLKVFPQVRSLGIKIQVSAIV